MNKKISTINKTYKAVKDILEEARRSTYKAVNFAMVQAYWHIGRVIVEDELKGRKKADYGEYLVKELSERLTREFGKGFTETNVRYMRLFHLSFEIMNAENSRLLPEKIHHALRDESRKLQKSHATRDELPVVRDELSWTHYRLLLKVERADVRLFYMDECVAANWSTRQLERQINSFYYERLLSSRNKKSVRAEIKKLEPALDPNDIIKDPYVLEFLGMKENKKYLETELEQGLIDKLHDFLLELGKGFSFVGRQKRITLDGDHLYRSCFL